LLVAEPQARLAAVVPGEHVGRIVLQCTFPVIDISRTGTRKEELITDPQVLKKMYVLRRILNPMGTMDTIDFLLDKPRSTKSNSCLS
jgi:transcription termination factor Rho